MEAVTDFLTYQTYFERCTNLRSIRGPLEVSDSFSCHAHVIQQLGQPQAHKNELEMKECLY